MKPFNLENFLEGEPAITRDGRKVIDWHYFKNRLHNYKLACLLSDGELSFYNDAGVRNENRPVYAPLDLFMEEKEFDLWINVYKEEGEKPIVYGYNTKELAEKNLDKYDENFKGTHKITIKE